MFCEYCGIKLGVRSSVISHINIAQSQKEHYFCSEFCKDNWCFRLQQQDHTIIVLWSIGQFRERYFFVKKHRKTREPSLVGAKGTKSFFISNLNHIRYPPFRIF